QKLAKKRGVDRVDLAVAFPDRERARVIMIAVGIEHGFQLLDRNFAHMPDAAQLLLRMVFAVERKCAFRRVLGKIADAFEVARDAERRDDLAEVGGEWLAARDHRDRALL